MKKLEKIICVLMLMCVTCSAFAWGKKAKKKKETKTLGALSYLNFSEEQVSKMYNGAYLTYKQLEEKGYLKVTKTDKTKISPTIKFYDTLDALLMALKSGEIWGIADLPQTTASYLCAKDKTLGMNISFDMKMKDEKKSFAGASFKRLSDGFSFMMLEKNKALCDQFNKIIKEMQEDGSMSKLIREQIIGAMNGSELKVIQPENKPGRETLKVAVTGALPPMDYVAADGTFAGFNTALLAEIGKRLDKNITMVQVSSVGRATALASGTVDVVFWTRSSAYSPVQRMSKEEFKSFSESIRAKQSPEEEVAFAALNEAYSGSKDGDDRDLRFHRDTPAGTVITVPYFEDMPVTVGLKN